VRHLELRLEIADGAQPADDECGPTGAAELHGEPAELPILLSLLDESEQRAGAAVLRRWVRASGPRGRPIDALLRRDFAAFEDAVADLAERGFVLRGGG